MTDSAVSPAPDALTLARQVLEPYFADGARKGLTELDWEYDAKELARALLTLAEAAEKVHYGPSKGHLAVKAWRELGEALAAVGQPDREQK